jgi:hypothetical protein
MLFVFFQTAFTLSKNLAHNSPQIEIFERMVFAYEKVFGHDDDVLRLCRRTASDGRGP